jgi:hypothetical protein
MSVSFVIALIIILITALIYIYISKHKDDLVLDHVDLELKAKLKKIHDSELPYKMINQTLNGFVKGAIYGALFTGTFTEAFITGGIFSILSPIMYYVESG